MLSTRRGWGLFRGPPGREDRLHDHFCAAALGRIKRLIQDGETRDLDSSLDAEAAAIAASAAGAEGREGVRAFRERRPPRFHDEPVSS